MTIIFWFLLILITDALAFYFIKKFSLDKTFWHYFILSILCYTITLWSLSNLLNLGEELSILLIEWGVISCLYGIFIGHVLFNETITKVQIFGMSFGIIAIILMMLDNPNL